MTHRTLLERQPVSVCHTAVRLSAQRRNSLWSSATSMWSGLDRRNTMLFMGDAIPEFQVFKHDPVCVCVCVHVRVCMCVHTRVYIGDITIICSQWSKFKVPYKVPVHPICTQYLPNTQSRGCGICRGQRSGTRGCIHGGQRESESTPSLG